MYDLEGSSNCLQMNLQGLGLESLDSCSRTEEFEASVWPGDKCTTLNPYLYSIENLELKIDN
jgi:hypothetical protein